MANPASVLRTTYFGQVMAQCLGLPTAWADVWRMSGRPEMATTHVPIIVHEDAVPHFSGANRTYLSMYTNVSNRLTVLCFSISILKSKFCKCCDFATGSTATIWSWSTGCLRSDSWKTRQAIALVATSQVTAATRAAICKKLAWDFAQLQTGSWDLLDSSGKFHPLGSKSESKAGQDMPLKGVAWIVFTCLFLLFCYQLFWVLSAIKLSTISQPRHFVFGRVTWKPTTTRTA